MQNARNKNASLAAALVLLALAVVACKPGDPARSTGAYPIDLFQEMHYNQTFKAGEPPRFLPPEDSVPISGGFIPAGTKADSADLTSPFPDGAQTLTRGALLFRQNCSMCHGLTAGGDGIVGAHLQRYTGVIPPAFDSARVRKLTPGEAYSSISRGFGLMPAFEGLLSEQDRWALVALIEAAVGERTSALEAVNGLDEAARTLRLLELRDDASG